MKNSLKFAAALVLAVAGMAFAGGVFTSRYNGTGVPPSGATVGIPLYSSVAGLGVQDVVLTIADDADAGTASAADDGGKVNPLTNCTATAWRYNPTMAAWYRDSTLDVACPAVVAGTNLVMGYSVEKALTTRGLPGERLYYTQTTAGDDAGSTVYTNFTLQGRY